jgi:hypothetical protein
MNFTVEDIPDMLQHIHKGMMAYMRWKSFYPAMFKVFSESKNSQKIKQLTENYYKVNNALLTYLNFMDENKEVLDQARDALMFGVIYAGTKDLRTEDEILQKAVDRYNKWYISGFKL